MKRGILIIAVLLATLLPMAVYADEAPAKEVDTTTAEIEEVTEAEAIEEETTIAVETPEEEVFTEEPAEEEPTADEEATEPETQVEAATEDSASIAEEPEEPAPTEPKVQVEIKTPAKEESPSEAPEAIEPESAEEEEEEFFEEDEEIFSDPEFERVRTLVGGKMSGEINISSLGISSKKADDLAIWLFDNLGIEDFLIIEEDGIITEIIFGDPSDCDEDAEAEEGSAPSGNNSSEKEDSSQRFNPAVSVSSDNEAPEEEVIGKTATSKEQIAASAPAVKASNEEPAEEPVKGFFALSVLVAFTGKALLHLLAAL